MLKCTSVHSGHFSETIDDDHPFSAQEEAIQRYESILIESVLEYREFYCFPAAEKINIITASLT